MITVLVAATGIAALFTALLRAGALKSDPSSRQAIEINIDGCVRCTARIECATKFAMHSLPITICLMALVT